MSVHGSFLLPKSVVFVRSRFVVLAEPMFAFFGAGVVVVAWS